MVFFLQVKIASFYFPNIVSSQDIEKMQSLSSNLQNYNSKCIMILKQLICELQPE